MMYIFLSCYLAICIVLAFMAWNYWDSEVDEDVVIIFIVFFPALLLIGGYWLWKKATLWLAQQMKNNADMRRIKKEKTEKEKIKLMCNTAQKDN